MARDPVKVSRDLDDNSLTHEVFVGVTDGTEQLLVNADGSLNATVNNASGASAVNIQDGGNIISIDDGGGSITVDGSVSVSGGAIDDASFTPATDGVTVLGGFADETAPDSVDEGDQGALRMTLDRKLLTRVVGATDANRLDVSAAGNAQVEVAIALPAGTNNIGDVDVATVPAPLNTTGGGTEATALRVTIANDSTGVVSVDDNGGSLTVDASQLDVDDLNDTDDKVAIGDGTDTLAINADGSINVVTQSASGTPIADYDEQSALGTGASDNHDYTASGGTFEPTDITVSSESIGTFLIIANSVSIAKIRTSVEHPNATYTFPDGFTIADTQVLRVTRTNDSNKSKDVNSTINGYQN